MKVSEILSLFKKYNNQHRKFQVQAGFLLKKIKQQPDLEPFDLFTIYNICSYHPKPCKQIIQYIQPSIAPNWITLYKRLTHMLSNQVIPNIQLINQFNQFLDEPSFNNRQITTLFSLLPMFKKNSSTPQIIQLKNKINHTLSQNIHQLSSYQIRISLKNINKNQNFMAFPIQKELSRNIIDKTVENIQRLTWTDLYLLEILQDKTFFNRDCLSLFKLIKANKAYVSLDKKGFDSQNINNFVSKITPHLRLNSEKFILQQQNVNHSRERAEYYKTVHENKLFQLPNQQSLQKIKDEFSEFVRIISLVQFQDLKIMIPFIQKNPQFQREDIIHMCFHIVKTGYFINLQKYPGYITIIQQILKPDIRLDFMCLNKMMHILTHLVVAYPQHIKWMKLLDNKFQQQLQTIHSENSKYNLSLLKLIGIQKQIVDSMPNLAKYLHNYFQYNVNKREAMFFHKLQYMMGKTKILPDNSFTFSQTYQGRSKYQQKLLSSLKGMKQIKIQSGVYYKGYQIDILLTHIPTNKKLYIDVCGSKHFYLNEQKLKINTQSKANFLKKLINYDIITPSIQIGVHNNRQQIQSILQKHFGIGLPPKPQYKRRFKVSNKDDVIQQK